MHIHTASESAKEIEYCRYDFIYLPPYPSELNPIEQFWSIVKSNLKRKKVPGKVNAFFDNT